MDKRIGLFLLSWLCAWSAFTQTVDAVILPPPQTAYIADFFSNPNLFRVIVTNKTVQPIDVKIGGKLILDGTTLGSTDVRTSDVFTLKPGVNYFNGEDIFKQFMRGNIAVDTSNATLKNAFYSGQWPSGLYEWCIEIRHATTNVELLPNKCARRFVTAYQAPVLILPNEGQVLNNPGTVVFRWTPITPGYKEGIVYYEVRVFDVKTGQTPMQAFQTNFPIIEKRVPSQTLLIWPGEVPIEGGQYIWTVRALDAQDRPISFPAQYADPLTFNIVKGAGGIGSTTGKLAFSAVFPQTESSVSTTEVQDKFLRFNVDLSALGAASTEASNNLRVYMIEKKAGYYTKAALQQAIQRDRLFYKSPLLNINAQTTNLELQKILPDSLAGREYAWIIRAEAAGRTYDSDLFTFQYKKTNEKILDKTKLKFDCECKDTLCAPPIIADRTGVSTWKVGDTLMLGRYEMRLTEWNNGNGKGIIELPYAKVGIKVGLSGIRANKASQILDGTATMEDSDFPKDIKEFGTFKLNAETLTRLNTHFASMSGALEQGLKMPFSFKQHLSALKMELPFDLIVTGMRFSPEASQVDLAVLIEHTPGQFVKFMAKNISMAANGISLNKLKLFLAEDIVVNNLSLKASNDEAKGSYIEFDCNGIKNFHLETALAFDPKQVQTLSDQTLTTTVKFDAASWGDFLTTASLEAFRLTNAKGITIEAKDWTLDKSTVRNPAGLKLPTPTVGKPEAWQGFFTEGVTVKVSKDLLPAADKDLELTGKDLSWDTLGLSGLMTATKFSLAAQGSDWNVGIDSFKVQIDKSKLAEMSFTGGLSLSYLFKDLKYKALFKRDSQDRMSYQFAPATDVEAKLWKTKFKLANTSSIALMPTQGEGDKTNWQLAANLDAEVSFDIANNDIDTGYVSVLKNLLGFSDFSLDIPTLTIKGLKINHPDLPAGQKIGVQSIKADRPFKLGGLEIDLVGVDFEADTLTVNGESRQAQVMVLHLSKEVDFDCKVWALRSDTDTSRWNFSKLSFGLPVPKIECKAPEALVLDKESTKSIGIGDKIKVGSFTMQVEKLASNSASGKGVIRIPYLATNIAVEFNNQLKINDSGIAFEGAALADVNAAILPTESLLNGFRKLNFNALNKTQLDGHLAKVNKTANILPLSFKKMLRSYGSKLPFDVLVTDLRFISSQPTLSLAMVVPIGEQTVHFELPQLAFNERGFNLSDVKLQLATTIDVGGGVRLLRGPDSYAQLNCSGFETFGLAGDYTLNANQFAAIGKSTAPLATFKAKTKQFSDFIATAEIEPFSVKAIQGSEISITNAIFDRSTTENMPTLEFPKKYKGNTEANWKGFYVQEFSMKMPSILPNQEDKMLTFSGKNLILDSTGVTTTIKASNITSVGNTAFGLNIKELTLDIVQNTVDSALLGGSVQLPLFSEAIDFEGTYAKDSTGTTTYALTTSNEANFNFWRANLKIGKGSSLELVKNNNKWERRASMDLEAKLDVNTRMLEEYVNADVLRGLKSALGVDLLDFEIPTFKFKGLKINHPKAKGGRQYSLDSYETTGQIKIAGQEIKLMDLDIVEDTVTVKGKFYKKGVGLVFQFTKGTDFELSTWAVPSEADTNKWVFGKWDLKFAIPKFECIQVPTESVATSGGQALKVGQAVNVGGFVMKVEQLASGTQKGVGKLRIPYFGSTLKVNFDAATQASATGQLLGGTLLSQVDEAVIPMNALVDEANGLRRVSVDKLNVNGLKNIAANAAETGIQLPLSLKQNMGRFGNKLPFDIWLTHINFRGSESYMSLAMLLPYGGANVARFSVPKVRLNAKGFNLSNLEIGLAQDLELASGLYLRGSEGADKTMGTLDCDGFKGLKLDGFYNLDKNYFSNARSSTPPQINFSGEAKSLSDFILDATVEPLRINDLERSELSVSKAVIDRSDTKNPGAIKFPATYKGNTGTNWTGVYVQDFTLKLPSMLPSQEDKMLTFNGKALILDSTGITALANATNITDIGASGFGMSVDTVSVNIVQNNLLDTRLAGRINLPLFGEGIRYAGTYAKDSTGTTTFALKTTAEANFNFWKANVKIQQGSGLELVKNSNNKWERRASIDLEAKLDVSTKMLEEYVSADILRGLKAALGVDLLDFEIPTFKFKGLKINHPKAKGGRQYALDAFESTGKIKIAGQEVKLNDVDIVEDTLTVKGKSYKKGVGLVFQFFKGTDFELSTWAVPSEADTNKWVFGKWDLKFAIPKFECAPVAPLVVDNTGSQPVELNKTVKIGSFSMVIDQAANGTQLGVGRIRIPYFGSTLKVNFDEKLRLNAKNEALGGVVWSLVNPAILPATSLLTEATTGLRNVKIAGLDINALSQIASGNSPIGISLPLSLKQSMGKFGRDLPFDVLVTHINFLGTAPHMSLAMLVPTPGGDLARFVVPRLPLSSKGFDLSNIQVQLADEMSLGKGFFLSGAETTTPTFANLNCGGLSGFQLNGYYELNRDLFSSVNGTLAPKARFTAKAEGLGQFIASATVEPLRINALNGSELTITNAILDRSNTENSSSAKFPKIYKGNKDATWQGLFIGDFTLKVPSFLPNQADKKLTLSGKNMVFDTTGATALIEATNVLAATSNTEGGWGLSVDTLNMTMVASKVDSAYLSGKIELPFFSQNIPYNGVFQANKTAPYYNLSTSADATIDFWRTSIGINKGSNVEIFKNAETSKWERRAKLNLEAKLDINTQALSEYVDANVLTAIKDALGLNLLDFELPKIKFNGFKINYPNLPAGRTFALDSISYTGRLRLGGQEIQLNTVELVQDSVIVKGKKFSKGVGLVFKLFKGVDFDFSIWSVPSTTDSTKWTFGKYDLNFGIPKFECVAPKPFVVENTTPRIPKVGEMVNLAGFSMKIDQLASAAQMGIARIRIPYLGTTVKVNFGESLSINAEGKVKAGVAFSQINNALFPNNAITTVANARRVAISQLNENALDQIIADNTPDGIKLPLSLRKSMGGFGKKLPFDVLLTNINFEGISPNMALAALVPDRSGKLVKFTVPSLGINSKGFSFSDLKFQLGENYQLSTGLFLNGSETEKKTSLDFNCDGFVSLNLDGYYQFDPQQFRLISGTGAPKLTFKGTATSLSNFIAKATADPMQIVGLDKSELRLTNLVFDRSTTENESTMRFPERYKGKMDASWSGIYVKEATLKLPSFLPNDGQVLSFSGKDVIVDSTGASGTFDATNVLKASAAGFGLQVDTVRLTVLQSKLDSAALMGALSVPLFEEPVKYMGRYKQDSVNTNLRVATTQDAALVFFGAKVTLLKGAEVEMDKPATQWVRRAKMDIDAEFKITKDSLTKYGGVVASLDKLMKDMGLPSLDFEFPKIKLRGLKVNHKSLPMGKNYGVDDIEKSGDLKIAGQTVTIRDIDLIESAKSMVIKGKTYAKSLALVFQLTKIVDTELAIYMVPDPKDATKWTFGKFEMISAIPKFECVAVTPETAPTGSVKALAVNQEVNVGDFKMKVTKLAAGTTAGEGEVRIPYMGTTVKVKFDNNFKVNTDGKAFGGIVTSDLNTASYFPSGSVTSSATVGNLVDAAKMKLDNLTSLTANDAPISMPMSLKQRLGRLGSQLPFDLLVTNINLASAKQSMSLAMLIPDVMGTTVRFSTDDLALNGKGFGLSSLQLGLAGDIKLADGLFLNGGANNLRTKAIFNCEGVESFTLAGRYEFPNTTFVKPLNGTGTTRFDFSGTSSNLTNFIVEATATPMQLAMIDGSELRLSRLSYDRSSTANPSGIKFPPQYGATVPTSWVGFYAEEASLAVPSLLPNQSGKLKFSGKNILLDDAGVSGQFQVQDLFSTKVDNLWSLKFDTLGVNVVKGKLEDIQVAGEIGFPVLGVSTRFDGKGIQKVLGKDTTYTYTLAPRGDLSMNAWRVNLSLLKSSKIDLVREQKAGKVTNTIDATLDAELSVDLNTDFIKNNADPAIVDFLKSKLGVNVLDFAFPKFRLTGLKINPTAAQKISFGTITPIGDLTLAGVKIDLVKTAVETAEIVTKAGRKAATGFVMTMRKGVVDFKFRVWAVPSSTDATKWEFGKLDVILDLAKFSCTNSSVAFTNKSPGSLAVNKTVKVAGGFDMRITQLASAGTPGKGQIYVKLLGTTYDVVFGTDLKVNNTTGTNEVIEGVISTLPNAEIFPAASIVKLPNGVTDLDLKKLVVTEALTTRLQNLSSVTKFPVSMSSALAKMNEAIDLPTVDIPLDITLTGIYFTPQGAMLGGFTTIGTDGKYLRMGVGGLTLHEQGVTFDKLKLFLVENL